MDPCKSCNGTGECAACVDADSYACNVCFCTGECPDCHGPSAFEDAAREDRPRTCACREPGQDGDGWVRYQARDGEFVTLRCRQHTTQEN